MLSEIEVIIIKIRSIILEFLNKIIDMKKTQGVIIDTNILYYLANIEKNNSYNPGKLLSEIKKMGRPIISELALCELITRQNEEKIKIAQTYLI